MIELILTALIGVAHADSLGVQQSRVARYRVTRMAGDGRDFKIEAIEPPVINLGPGSAPSTVSISVRYAKSATNKDVYVSGVPASPRCSSPRSSTGTCTVSFNHPAGKSVTFNIWATRPSGMLPPFPEKGDSNYRVEVPVVRIEAVKPMIVQPRRLSPAK